MNITTSFVVKSPIYGYSGMGYESVYTVEESFDTEEKARTHLALCNQAYNGKGGTMAEDIYFNMTECLSFKYTGPSTLVKRTIIEEQICS